jgi:hypothetical protein
MRSRWNAAVLQVLRFPRPHEWLLLAVLVFFTDRYRWMMDDAFVYFRYADNLVFLGRGLVYNAGEFVEGFSSPLWMLMLLPLRALGINYYSLVRLLGFVLSLAYGTALIWVNRRLCPTMFGVTRETPNREVVVNFPLAASAAHYGITTHFSSGLETPLVQLFAPLYAAALLSPGNAVLQCVVALAPLVRSECALLAILYLPFAIVRTRRIPWWFLGFGSAANGGWLLFRVIYYADFLPNTFYLKDAAQWRLGREYWENVLMTHHWGVWSLALAICAVLGRGHLRNLGARLIMLAGATAYALYVARIGGDMLYHRYAALPVCLGLCAVAGVVESALVWLATRRPLPHLQLWAAAVAILIGLAFGLAYPPQLKSHPVFLQPESRKWQAIADPNWHRSHPDLVYDDRRSAEDQRLRKAYANLREQGESPAPPIIVEGFCVAAFRRFDAQVVHDYGLTDPVLARLPRPFGRPGHKLVQNEALQMAKLKRAARQNSTPWYDDPKPPRWVQKNRAVLAQLDQKLHNNHNLLKNLSLATSNLQLKK